MNTLPLSTPTSKPTRLDMKAVTESKLPQLQLAAVRLLERAIGTKPREPVKLRAEIVRLKTIYGDIVRLLSFDKVEEAYKLATSGLDQTDDGFETPTPPPQPELSGGSCCPRPHLHLNG